MICDKLLWTGPTRGTNHVADVDDFRIVVYYDKVDGAWTWLIGTRDPAELLLSETGFSDVDKAKSAAKVALDEMLNPMPISVVPERREIDAYIKRWCPNLEDGAKHISRTE